MKFRLPAEAADPEPPPILNNWPRVYLVVVGWLVFLILLSWAFTRYFS